MNSIFKLLSWRDQGFTLVELLVVIAIVGLLASLILVNFQQSAHRSKIARANLDLQQLKTAFQAYYNDRNDYPPFGVDSCSACYARNDGNYNEPTRLAQWQAVVNDLAPYMEKRLERDPWGVAFAYDKNYQFGCWNAWSILCSTGPNKRMDTDPWCSTTGTVQGDDVCIFFPDRD